MRILLCGDTPGVSQLLSHVPIKNVVGVIGASIRPHYFTELERLAEKLGVPLLIQPKWKTAPYEEFSYQVSETKADLIWVNSYSMIIRDDVLSTTRLGGLNIHGALLPRNRGCNPIQWSIIKQEYETGVTLHEMDSGLDTGPIIDQREVAIFFEDTWMAVRDRLIDATDELLRVNVPKILSGNWNAISQHENQATVNQRRTPYDGAFSWKDPLIDIHNKIRALVPPIPPAFYLKPDGTRIEIAEYQTPWQLAEYKYGLKGGGRMQSDYIRLRPMQKADAPLLYQWITNRELVIHNAPYFPVTESDHEAWIERMMTKCSDLVIFVIEELESGRAIGTCQLVNINWIHRSAELQIRIGDSADQNRGIGSDAVNILCEFGYKDLNLHRIYLHVFANNNRAIRAYEKTSFKHEGLMRQAAFLNGERQDVVVMGRLKNDI